MSRAIRSAKPIVRWTIFRAGAIQGAAVLMA
jgi:hypothetical protein